VKFIALFLLMFVVGCQTTPKNPEAAAEKQINACLPNAIIMSQALKRHNVWSRVLIVKWSTQQRINGHAYTIYLYPPGQNQLWAYDSDWGSMRIRAFKDNVKDVALKANQSRRLYHPITFAEYLD
jgi:hypothetical protein